MINEILNSFLEINKIHAHSVGDAARLLASRTKYYKNLINEYHKNQATESFYKELVNLHIKLVEVEVTKKDKNHMIHDSVNFIERLINEKMKKRNKNLNEGSK